MKSPGTYRALALAAALLSVLGYFVLIDSTDASMAQEKAPSKAPALESVGPLTFAPDGTLFLADPYSGAVHALEMNESAAEATAKLNMANLDQRVASLLGTPVDRILIHDIAVSPVSQAAFITVSRGASDDGTSTKVASHGGRSPHLLRVGGDNQLSEVSTSNLPRTTARFKDVRTEGTNRWGQDNRSWSILEMAYAEDTLYVSGTSNEEWSAKVRRIAYPFTGSAESTAIKIFHTAHGKWETGAPARVFAPYRDKKGSSHLFAGFSCTPLVTFSTQEMRENKKVTGKTIAELGAGNHVLDMLAVERNGRTSFLLANHLHPFMRLDLDDFGGAASLTQPTRRAGIDRHPLGTERRVVRVAALGSDRVLLLRENSKGGFDLETAQLDDLLGAA